MLVCERNVLGEREDVFGNVGVCGSGGFGVLLLLFFLESELRLLETLLLQIRDHRLLYLFFLHLSPLPSGTGKEELGFVWLVLRPRIELAMAPNRYPKPTI